MFGDDWWKHYGFDWRYQPFGNPIRPPHRPTFFDDLMNVAEKVLESEKVIDRVKAKRSATVKVQRGDRIYKVVVEDVTDAEMPPVRIDILDENGDMVEDIDKHEDFTE